MSLISHNQLKRLVERNLLTNTPEERINAASIDLSLARTIKVEVPNQGDYHHISFSDRDPMVMATVDMPDEGYTLYPGEFILAATEQIFNLPNWISGEYKLKSSMARIGLDHLNAGWADAGWNGSALTLEFKNTSLYHCITIKPGDLIGQMVFFSHAPVPKDKSYSVRGRYNGDKSVSGIKK